MLDELKTESTQAVFAGNDKFFDISFDCDVQNGFKSPDAYKVDGVQKRTPYEKWVTALKETLIEVFNIIERGEVYKDIHTEIKLFYDE